MNCAFFLSIIEPARFTIQFPVLRPAAGLVYQGDLRKKKYLFFYYPPYYPPQTISAIL